MKPIPSRDALLEQAFSEIPLQIASYQLRPLSAGSFTLLARLGNPMIGGKSNPAVALPDRAEMFESVIQYIWVHSADLDAVMKITEPQQIPEAELQKIGFTLSIGQAMEFLMTFADSALRMSAGLTEVEPEESDELGKPPESLPVGSPASFTPAVPAETPSGSDTSSGSCPSSELFPTSTPPMSPTEPAADGACLILLPDLSGTTPQS
jgi:hypothetical protein